MKLSVLALALGVSFSGSAFAATNVWNTSAPWGSASTAQYAEWNAFDGALNDDSAMYEPVLDTTPNVSLSAGATASVNETSGGASGAFVTGTGLSGNIYSFSAATQFTATLSGATGGFYDVYLRLGTLGTSANVLATLNGVAGTATVTTIGASAGGGSEQELFWKWTVAGSNLYTFQFAASGSSMSLDQLALATVSVATPVPEPEAYGMMAIGLGLVAVARRRAGKTKA